MGARYCLSGGLAGRSGAIYKLLGFEARGVRKVTTGITGVVEEAVSIRGANGAWGEDLKTAMVCCDCSVLIFDTGVKEIKCDFYDAISSTQPE